MCAKSSSPSGLCKPPLPPIARKQIATKRMPEDSNDSSDDLSDDSRVWKNIPDDSSCSDSSKVCEFDSDSDDDVICLTAPGAFVPEHFP